MNALTDIAIVADDLIQAAGQWIQENPVAILGIAIASWGGAVLAGFAL